MPTGVIALQRLAKLQFAHRNPLLGATIFQRDHVFDVSYLAGCERRDAWVVVVEPGLQEFRFFLIRADRTKFASHQTGLQQRLRNQVLGVVAGRVRGEYDAADGKQLPVAR